MSPAGFGLLLPPCEVLEIFFHSSCTILTQRHISKEQGLQAASPPTLPREIALFLFFLLISEHSPAVSATARRNPGAVAQPSWELELHLQLTRIQQFLLPLEMLLWELVKHRVQILLGVTQV